MQKLHSALLIIGCVAGIVLLNVGFIFMLLGFLPTVVAYFVDDTEKKDLYKTVRATNLAGILPSMMELTRHGNPGAALQIAMSDPSTWLIVYGSAAIGYGLIWFCRWGSYFSMIAAAETRIYLLEQAEKHLIDEWGEEIKEFVISEEPVKAG